ncbi:zinc finger protein 19-like [Cylas formicarius]|uniref:zinc finger protein 19-like n=1 Tax=Cylas formicarius TaxID=197179 RepID=UPI002958452B|nr:zinc finger protein 19-like [Cylas formicarius]XP_060517316.1 zinc finger protein 19-like [Cylas formicarius]
MDKVIKDGTLHLQTTESTCDVILSCQGSRLMAHKLILSIASPTLRDILRRDCAEATVIILPDIKGSTMSSILDYIYTGNTVVYSNTIEDFLSVAKFLKIQLDTTYLQNVFPDKANFCGVDVKKIEDTNTSSKCKTLKKVPELLPIGRHASQSRKPCNLVIPSPWCPRIDRPCMDDPRKVYLAFSEDTIQSQPKQKLEDSNNNFPVTPNQQCTQQPKYLPKKLNNVVRHLRFNVECLKDKPGENARDILHAPKTPSQNNLFKNVRETADDTESNVPEGTATPDVGLNLSFLTNANSISNSFDFKCETMKSKSSDELPVDSSSNDNLTDSSGSVTNGCGKSSEKQRKTENGTEKRRVFNCDDCGKTFSQLRNYKYHRSVHDGTKEFSAKCTECGKVFNDKGYLSSHMKIHRDKKEYACPHCPKRFNQRVAYNMHLRIHTGVKPHECPTCGKTFSRKMLLKQHQRVHTGERPYSCPECGKTFADRSNMSLHARLHTGIKPYACNLCPKSFTKKHHLKTHLNFHTGLKPYSCENCGLAFSQSSNMRTHYKKCILKAGDTSSIDNNSS